MKELLFILILLVAISLFFFIQGEKKKVFIITEMEKIEINVEIANNSITQAKGLMGRTVLNENEGMLFIFNNESTRGFWMVNTSIPLEAIHFSKDKVIVDIIEMEPCRINCKIYYPKMPSKYVIEVNQGFTKNKKISIGDKLLYE